MTVWMLSSSLAPESTKPTPSKPPKVKPTLTPPYTIEYPLEDTRPPIGEYFWAKHAWNRMEIEFPSEEDRDEAINSGNYIPRNILPLGLEIWEDRIFVTLPMWRNGIPVSLTTIDKADTSHSPVLRPYPDWSWYDVDSTSHCEKIISAFRVATDPCGRLWVLDSGSIDIATNQGQPCPPKLLIFDLATDQLLHKYTFPSSQVFDGSLLSHVVVDVRDDCNSATAFVADVFRYGLIVYSLEENRSWRIGHAYFYPDPLLSDYRMDNIRWQWVDGIFSLTLSPVDPESEDRYLYFHALSSNREFRVPVSKINTEPAARNSVDDFEAVGDPRGGAGHHASGSAMDNNGVLFYNMPSLKAIGCWNSRSYKHSQYSQGLLAVSNDSLSFANDMKLDFTDVDQDGNPRKLYIMANRLHQYLYGRLDPVGPNYFLTVVDVSRAVRGTVCEPNHNLLGRPLVPSYSTRLGRR